MRRPWIFRPFEFWPNETHVIPFHVFLFFTCLRYGLSLKSALKANYGIPHGGMAFVSKFEIQSRIGSEKFPPTILLASSDSRQQRRVRIELFGRNCGYPLIVKPDAGMTGRGLFRVGDAKAIDPVLSLIEGHDYLVQGYVPGDYEYGVFWHRRRGETTISGINEKHYPVVVGDGHSSLAALAQAHPRFTAKWESFLRDHDRNRVPEEGEKVFLSRIGSHTLGSLFTDETDLLTPELKAAVDRLFEDFPGFNYGRLDLKAMSPEAFRAGEFEVIEVNGVESQATQMFDPGYGYGKALRFLWYYAKTLARIGHEHRKESIEPISYWEIVRNTHRNIREMNELVIEEE